MAEKEEKDIKNLDGYSEFNQANIKQQLRPATKSLATINKLKQQKDEKGDSNG